MDTVDLKLAQDCEALAVSASEGVDVAEGRRGRIADRGAAGAVADQRAAEGPQPEPQARPRRPPAHVRRRVRPEPGRQVLSRLDPGQPRRPADAGALRRQELRLPARDQSAGQSRIDRPGHALRPGPQRRRQGIPGPRAAADADRHREDPGQLLPARLRSSEGGLRAARWRRHPQAPGRAARQGRRPALRRSRFRRRARPDRVFRHLLRRRHRRAAHRFLARGDRSRAAPVGPRPRPAVVGAVVRLPALHRSLPDAVRRPAEALLRHRGVARHGRADPAREEHRRRPHARPAGRR